MSGIDTFKAHAASMPSPVGSATTIAPSDTVDLAHLTRALYLGATGKLRVDMADGPAVTFANLAVSWHPVRMSRVGVTGTAANSIVGCW